MEILANGVGILGVIAMLAAYFLLQKGAFGVHDPRYLCANLFGALAVVFSLIWAWNWPAFLIECAWALVSAWSLARVLLQRSAR